MEEISNCRVWFSDYIIKMSSLLYQIDQEKWCKIRHMAASIINTDHNIWLAGNGGSTMNAFHAAQDIFKGIKCKTGKLIKCQALGTNISLVTAIANDISYNDIFSFEIEQIGEKDDLLIGLSVSGNSPNIVKAFNVAKNKEIKTIAMVGNKGDNKLGQMADFVMSFDTKHFGMAEDLMMIVLHSLAYSLMEA